MLVLSRKRGESIVIDGQIKVTISEVHGGRVKLVIDAPRSRKVMRCEIAPEFERSAAPAADGVLASTNL
jgi:carbon storage regulator